MPDTLTDTATGDVVGAPTAATDRATTAADKLWAALHARPGATAEQLAHHAGIGRSTAAKILTRWVADTTVHRTTGSAPGKRPASRFAIAPPVPAATPRTPTTTPPAVSGAPSGPDSRTDGGDTGGDTPVVDVRTAATPAPAQPPTNPDPTHAPGADDPRTAGRPHAPGPGPRATTSRARLAPGALHGMVEDYLRDHPDTNHGPTSIGRDLGRSAGAIANALERLVTTGYAIRTQQRPKRYRLAAHDAAGAAPEA